MNLEPCGLGFRGQIPARPSGPGHWFLICGLWTTGHLCRQWPHPNSCFLDTCHVAGIIPALLSLKLFEQLTDTVGLCIFPLKVQQYLPVWHFPAKDRLYSSSSCTWGDFVTASWSRMWQRDALWLLRLSPSASVDWAPTECPRPRGHWGCFISLCAPCSIVCLLTRLREW